MDEEIMQVLEKIKHICEDIDCDICPFSTGDNDCTFTEYTPSGWILNKPDSPYRYFR